MNLFAVTTYFLYAVLAALVGWGVYQMRATVRRRVPPPASLTDLEREQFIPFPVPDLVHDLFQLKQAAALDKAARRTLKHAFARLARIWAAEAQRMSANLRDHFSLFDPQSPAPPAGLDPERVREKEDHFLRLWRRILERANFKPLSQEELDFALSEDYLSTLPIEINFERLDPQPLTRFNSAHKLPPGSHQPHANHDRIWVYRRGLGRDRTSSFFFLEKANLLLQEVVQWAVTCVRAQSGPAGARPAPPDAAAKAGAEAGHRRIGRVTLEDIVDFSKKGLRRSLLERHTLQEPTFREIVLLYRTRLPTRAPSSPPPADAQPLSPSPPPEGAPVAVQVAAPAATTPIASASASPGRAHEREEPAPGANPLGIHIKTFVNIPLADLEIVFPEKVVHMRPLDLLKFVATGCVAVLTAIANLKRDASAMLAGGLIVTLVALASKVFLDYTTALREYDNLLTRSLYDKSLNNHTGAIVYLIDQVAQQETKESVLAYGMLLIKGPATLRKLDRRCEKLLHRMSRRAGVPQRIDFDCADAVDKLLRVGVVTLEGEHYKPLPPTDALAALGRHWADMLADEA